MTSSLSNEPVVTPNREAADRLAALRQSIAEGSGDPSAYVQLGGMLAQSGDLAGAEQAMRRAAELEPDAARHRINLARLLHRAGKRDEAGNLLRDMVASGSASADAYSLLGQMLLESRELQGAEKAFRKAVELNPKAPVVRKSLAAVLDRQGFSNDAIGLLRPAVEDGTADRGTCALLGQILARLGDLTEAENVIRRAMELYPGDMEFRVELANLMRRQRRRGEALAMLHELAASITTDAHSLHRTGRLLEQCDDRPGSEQAIRRAIELEPDNQEFRITLAVQLLKWKRRVEALVLAWELRAEGCTHRDLPDLWTRAIARSGSVIGAEQALRKELRTSPSDPGLRGTLADVLCEQGRFREAMRVLLNRTDNGTENIRILATLGRIRKIVANGSDAAPVPEHAIEAGPAMHEPDEVTAEPAPPPTPEAVTPAARTAVQQTNQETSPRPVVSKRPLRRALHGFSVRLATIIGKPSRQPK